MCWYRTILFAVFSFVILHCGNTSAYGQYNGGELAEFADKLELTPAEKKQCEQRIIQKTEKLDEYLSLISSKTASMVHRYDAINLACQLFINEDKWVEVSSTSRNENTRFKIRDYLKHLMNLQYDRVEIKFREIYFVTELRKGTDEAYHGTVTAIQTFRGITGEAVEYQDVTKKNFNVKVTPYQKQVGDTIETKWDVYLGNIKVEQTKNK